MPATCECQIVTADREIFSGKVQFLNVEGKLGELGIYPGHTPLLTNLVPGALTIRQEDGTEQTFYTGGGFLEVQPKQITALVDSADRVEDLDAEAIAAAEQEAQAKLANTDPSDAAHAQARAALMRSMAQLRSIRRKMR